MTTHPTPSASAQRIRAALRLYRVMAIVSGIALFVLIGAMILRYGFGHEQFSRIWSPIHGFIYMVYAGAIVNLGLKAGWSFVRIVLNMLTGFVPVLPFIAERRVAADTESLLARMDQAAEPGRAATTQHLDG